MVSNTKKPKRTEIKKKGRVKGKGMPKEMRLGKYVAGISLVLLLYFLRLCFTFLMESSTVPGTVKHSQSGSDIIIIVK